MGPYRNIDQVVADRSVCITIGPGIKIVDWPGIPGISDAVSLNKYSLIVKIFEILNNNELFRGTVAQGYFPENEEDWLNNGALVEFSRKKIGSIHKS
jgi:hypothetical protein